MKKGIGLCCSDFYLTVISDPRHPRVCQNIKTDDWNGPFVSFWRGFGLSGLVMAFLTLCITWLFAKKMSFVFSHRIVNMVYKRVCRNCPISSCGATYLVRLANHLADVHQLDHIQRRQYLQEAKLQPKVKVVFYESEADNSGKKSLNWYSQPSTDTRNGVQTVKITKKWSLF